MILDKLMINKRTELVELSHFIIISTLTALIWFTFFKLGFNDLIANNDGAHLYRLFDHMTQFNLNARQYSYDSILHGGTETWSKVGISWFQEGLVSLGFSAANILNIIIMSIQVWISYFSLQFIKPFIDINKFSLPKKIISHFIAVLTISFAPYLFWRFSNGHIYFLFGMVSFLAYASLIFNFYKKSTTVFSLLLSFIALTISIPTNGQQLVIYFLYGSFPLLFIDFKRLLRPIYLASLVGLAALLFSYASFHSLIEHFFFDSIHRASKEGGLIYSYTTQNIWDFINGLFFEPYIYNQRKSFLLLHETNYPIGPYLLVILFTGISKARILKYKKLIIAFAVSFIFQHMFSHNIWPVNDILSSLPMMNSFRVPARSIMISCYFLSLISVIIILKHLQTKKYLYKVLLIIPASFYHIRYLDLTYGFLFAFIALCFIALIYKKKYNLTPYLLAIFIGYSASYAELRLYPFTNIDKLTEVKDFFMNSFNIKSANPTQVPIERSEASFTFGSSKLSNFDQNAAYLMGLRSFSGLHHVSPREDIFLATLNAKKPNIRASINLSYAEQGSLIYDLYNIKNFYFMDYQNKEFARELIRRVQNEVSKNKVNAKYFNEDNLIIKRENNRFSIKLITDYIRKSDYDRILKYENHTFGTYWFPTQLETFNNIVKLFIKLGTIHYKNQLDQVKDNLFINTNHRLSGQTINKICNQSTVQKSYINFDTNTIHYQGNSPDECIMVIPFNYSPKMVLNGLSEHGLAYELLTYVKTSKGKWSFSISFDETISPRDDLILKLMGVFLLLFTARFIFYRKDHTSVNKALN